MKIKSFDLDLNSFTMHNTISTNAFFVEQLKQEYAKRKTFTNIIVSLFTSLRNATSNYKTLHSKPNQKTKRNKKKKTTSAAGPVFSDVNASRFVYIYCFIVSIVSLLMLLQSCYAKK